MIHLTFFKGIKSHLTINTPFKNSFYLGIARAFFDFRISRQHMQLCLLGISASDDRCCIKLWPIFSDLLWRRACSNPPRCQSVGIHRHKCLILLWRLHPINNRRRAVGSRQCQTTVIEVWRRQVARWRKGWGGIVFLHCKTSESWPTFT